IVASGTPERITAGLELLQEEKISALLISGVADVCVEEGVWRCNPQIDREKIEAKVYFDQRIARSFALNTKGNALIGLEWLEQERVKGAQNCILITSEGHMPRLSITMKRVMEDAGGV